MQYFRWPPSGELAGYLFHMCRERSPKRISDVAMASRTLPDCLLSRFLFEWMGGEKSSKMQVL